MVDASNPFLPGTRSVVFGPTPLTNGPARATPLPGSSLSIEELKQELLKQGFSPDAINGLEVKRPKTYEGHRKCSDCGHFIPNPGYAIEMCPVCKHCRHAVLHSGVCKDCGIENPPPYEMKPEHFDIHFLADNGTIEKTVKG